MGLEGPLGRIHTRFEKVYKGLPTRVAQWRCRGLAHLCKMESRKAEEKDGEPAAPVTTQKPLEEFASLAAFPPRFRDIPCKPLLFDLAFPCIVQPDLEQLLPQLPPSEGGQQKGFLGRVAGGLGNRLGGLWGRK